MKSLKAAKEESQSPSEHSHETKLSYFPLLSILLLIPHQFQAAML